MPATKQLRQLFRSAGLAPLSFEGTAAQAVALLQATLATFPEATINSTKALYLEATFTTKIGFRIKLNS